MLGWKSLFNWFEVVFEYFPTAAGNDFRIQQLKEPLVAPDAVSNFLVNLDKLWLFPKAAFEVHCCPEKLSILCPSAFWRLHRLVYRFSIRTALYTVLIMSLVN